MPLLFAFIYLKTSALIQKFGAATALNGFVVIIFVLAGEVDVIAAAIFIILTALAEVIRYYNKYDTLKGVRRSFIPFGLSFYAYTIHWWTDTEGSLAAAVEEMPAGYDQLMKPVIDNTPMLCVAILIGIPVAMLAIRLAERCMKKQAGLLK